MNWKILKKIGKKILPYIGAACIGLTSVYCDGDKAINKFVNENQKPVIITDSLEEAVAGKYYKKEIKVSDPDGDNLEVYLSNAPYGMILKKRTKNIYEIKWSPIHSNLSSGGSQTGNFDVEISASDGIDTTTKNFNLFVNENPDSISLDYLRTDENIRFACEDPCLTPGLVEVNKTSLDEFSNGVFNAVKTLRDVVKSDAPLEMKPVDYRVVKDSDECVGDIPYLYYTLDGRYMVCNPKNYDTNGNMLVFNTNYSLSDIENHGVGIHEYMHAIFNGNPDYASSGGKIFQEISCNSTSDIVSGINGNDSFCDLGNISCVYNPPLICYIGWEPPGSFKYLTYNLCKFYGFDIKDMPELFKGLKASTDITIQNSKCIIDEIVSKNLGVQTDTTYAFIQSGITEVGECGTY